MIKIIVMLVLTMVINKNSKKTSVTIFNKEKIGATINCVIVGLITLIWSYILFATLGIQTEYNYETLLILFIWAIHIAYLVASFWFLGSGIYGKHAKLIRVVHKYFASFILISYCYVWITN